MDWRNTDGIDRLLPIRITVKGNIVGKESTMLSILSAAQSLFMSFSIAFTKPTFQRILPLLLELSLQWDAEPSLGYSGRCEAWSQGIPAPTAGFSLVPFGRCGLWARFWREQSCVRSPFQNSLDEHLNNTDSLFSVDSIELNLAVNAEGGIEMIGKLTAGVQSSVKVLLRKRQSEKE